MGNKKSKKALLKPENMTIYEAMDIHAAFLQTLQQHNKIKVDLSEVAEIDSSGLQLMLALKNDAQQQGKKVKFIAPSEDVASLLNLFDMAHYFTKSTAESE